MDLPPFLVVAFATTHHLIEHPLAATANEGVHRMGHSVAGVIT